MPGTSDRTVPFDGSEVIGSQGAVMSLPVGSDKLGAFRHLRLVGVLEERLPKGSRTLSLNGAGASELKPKDRRALDNIHQQCSTHLKRPRAERDSGPLTSITRWKMN